MAPCSASPGNPLQQRLVPAPPSARPCGVGSCLKSPPPRCSKFPGAKLEMSNTWTVSQCSGLEANTGSSDDHRKVTSAGDNPTWRTRRMLHCIFTPGMVHRGTTAKALLGILATELLRLSLFIYFQDCQSGERRRICAVPALTFHRQHDGSEDHDESLQRIGVDDSRQPPCTRARHSVRSAAGFGLSSVMKSQ